MKLDEYGDYSCPNCGDSIEPREVGCHVAICKTRPLQRARRLGKVDFGSLREFIEGTLENGDKHSRRGPFPSTRAHLEYLLGVLKKKEDGSDIRRSAIDRIRFDIEKQFSFASAPRARRLDWDLLPPGKWGAGAFAKYFDKAIRKRGSPEYRPERIEAALRLKPCQIYLGKTGRAFEGYAVFCFPRTQAAILEHPYVGNALYLLRRGWEELSRLSKGELLDGHHREVDRVVHIDGWQSRARDFKSTERAL
jgi:hypothetical protein